MVKDIFVGTGSGTAANPGANGQFLPINNVLYFIATDGVSGSG